VRFVFAPKDIEKLYKEFRDAFLSARNTEPNTSPSDKRKFSLWPISMHDFLNKAQKLINYFVVKAYILDPVQCKEPTNGFANPQSLAIDTEPLEKLPFDGLIKIDIIHAQRGFSDPKTDDDSHTGFDSLSKQLRKYYNKHLDPSDSPDAKDIEVLRAIDEASNVFNEKLTTSFAPAIAELKKLDYPGYYNPEIFMTSKINAIDTFKHDSAVQYIVAPEKDGNKPLALPEQYNGLGYQNLISMVFSLIRFRDEWMHKGKASKKANSGEIIIEPLHLVLIEEPEAHLHAQVQQVFIKKAYGVLIQHEKLENHNLKTQMIVSTHSSHIAHEVDFTCLRYFRREGDVERDKIPTATVLNLSKTFGDDLETLKFAARYIKSTHCDLFFADAVILVEGSAERMLLPHFIEHNFTALHHSYISILEIGGSHAHRLRPLLEILGLLSLVITDLDSIGDSGPSKVFPELGKGYRTGNTTLKEWIPKKKLLDDLLDCTDEEKSKNKQIRVAYQCPITLKFDEESDIEEEAIPYTFEDSLALTNKKLFRGYGEPIGLLKKLKDALGKATLSEACAEMFKSLGKGNKAEMALELLFLTDPSELVTPVYIADGLKWLEDRLGEEKQKFSTFTATEEKHD